MSVMFPNIQEPAAANEMEFIIHLITSTDVESYLSGSVGLSVEGQLSGSWADSGICSVHLSGVDNGAVGVSGRGRGHEGSEGDDGELHLDFGG